MAKLPQSFADREDFAEKAARGAVIVLTYVGPVALAFFVLSLISLYFK